MSARANQEPNTKKFPAPSLTNTARTLTWSCAPTKASRASSNRSTIAHLAGVPRASSSTGSTSGRPPAAAAVGGEDQPLPAPDSAPGEDKGGDFDAVALTCVAPAGAAFVAAAPAGGPGLLASITRGAPPGLRPMLPPVGLVVAATATGAGGSTGTASALASDPCGNMKSVKMQHVLATVTVQATCVCVRTFRGIALTLGNDLLLPDLASPVACSPNFRHRRLRSAP